VLVCDDEPDIRLLYRSAFTAAGAEVAVADDGDTALEVAATFSPDLVVLDLQMPRKPGQDALPEFAKVSPAAVVIIVSAHLRSDQLTRMLDLGAKQCFEKLDFLNRIPTLVQHYGAAA
jgi:DNA-binding response OmpR family regulator